MRAIAGSLTVELSERERRTIDRIPHAQSGSAGFYRRAEYQVSGLTETESLLRALAAYHRAFDLDPEFAEAYAGLARVATTFGGATTANHVQCHGPA